MVNPLVDCPVCEATGKVAGRLSGHKKLCPECGGSGRISLIKREMLLKCKKESERA
jgi:DnaJ-class molecular chaperone